MKKRSVCLGCNKICKLAKAHIYPKSVFHFIFNRKNTFWVDSNPESYLKKTLSGAYDDSILCGDCDSKIGKLDDRALNILFKCQNIAYQASMVPYFYLKNKEDYESIIKFFISILFRASISTREEFIDIKMDRCFEEYARKSLFDDNFDYQKYFSIIIALVDINIPAIMPGNISRQNGINVWTFVLGYLKVSIRFDIKPFYDDMRQLQVSDKNNVLLWDDRGYRHVQHDDLSKLHVTFLDKRSTKNLRRG